MATILSQIAHILLLVHALGNILQGVVTLADPDRYRRMTGTLFTGAPDKALGAIGEYTNLDLIWNARDSQPHFYAMRTSSNAHVKEAILTSVLSLNM